MFTLALILVLIFGAGAPWWLIAILAFFAWAEFS